MDSGGTFIIEHWSGTFRVASGAAGAPGVRPAHDTASELFALRHAFANHHRDVVEPIERWFRAGRGASSWSSRAFQPRAGGAFGAAPSVGAWERTRMEAWDAFETAVRSGALELTRVHHEPVFVTAVEPPQTSKLESPREDEPTHFEATIVDEVGQPIAGLEMVLSCEGQNYDLVTNGAGKVRQEGVTASRASLRVKNTQQLRDIVGPRWNTPRSGAFPQAKILLRAELVDGMGSFPLAAKDEHLIVVTPVLAPLHVEWWDGRGKHRHVECSYQVSGPRSFSGKTDPNGQLLHPDVPLGEYTLKLTVEYFKGRAYAKTRTFEEKVTLTKGTGLQVLRVGPTPEVAFRRTRGYLFDKSKSFLMPRAAKQLRELPTWWKDRAPSQLLIVGHTDVTGEQAFNDVLSQSRADAVKAFLEQDVDAWLAFYDEQGATKWGSREDRLMIRSLPDFPTRLTEGAAGGEGAAGSGETAIAGHGSNVNGVGSQNTNGSSSSSGTQDTNGAGSASTINTSNGAASNGAAANGTKPKANKPESIVEWFQRTRGLEVDDIAGPKTRRALISEYMGVGTVTLRETPGCPVSIATLGEGEDYPLAETGLPLDVAASNTAGSASASGASGEGAGSTEVSPLDRRVELFFFDTDFGILPPVGDVGGPEYTEWRKRVEEESDIAVEKEVQEAKYLAVRNAQFRTGSAVMLPEGDAPSSDGKAPLTSVGTLAMALRYNEEQPGHTMLVAGHTDSVGSDKDNDKLSEQRAQLVHAVLTGGAAGRSTFQDIANETGTVSDWKQILKWASVAFPSVEELVEEEVEDDDSAPSDDGAETEPADGALGTGFGACDPGEIDDNPKTGVDAVKAFQTAYNENYKLLGGSGEISVDGDVGKQTWGAIYDLYQYNLAQELGETFDGLKELQGLTNLLPTSKPYVGFGESAPADGTFEDNADEQLNRRVEVLFFEYGQEPDVALLDEDPHVSDLYHGETFERAPLDERWPADVRVVGIEGVFEYVKDTFPLLDSPKAFEIAMRKVFGDDLSRDTIDALRNELASGSFPPPGFEITDALPQGVRGAYSTGLIHVSRKTAESARVDALARWKLFTVMLEEYGHYVDDQVRRRLATDVARDAVGDEGTRFGAFYMCYHELFTTDFDFGALRVRRGLRKPIRRSRLQIAQGNPPTEERAKFFLWAQEEGSDSGYVTVKGETYQAEYFKIEGQGAVHERITREAAKAAGVTFDDRLDIGVAWPDVPTWDENSPPAPTASSVMTKDQVRYNSPHAAYAAFLSMETAHNMGKADKNSPAYKSHYGQNQFWHAMSPGKHLTNGQVRDKILRQHEIWWSWALANRFATVGVPLPTGILP